MKSKARLYWHIHHQELLEPAVEPIKNRIEYIKAEKPKDEQELRLKLLRPVRGKLPEAMLIAAKPFVKVARAYSRAAKAYYNPRAAIDGPEAIREREARVIQVAAQRVFKSLVEKNMPEIIALHDKECPKCPWNGKTIFPE